MRDEERWEEWVRYILEAVERTAGETIRTIDDIRGVLMQYKHQIRERYRFYSQDLVNNLFQHPYTKIEFAMKDLNVSRITATKYLDTLAAGGFLHKHRLGRSNYYINAALARVLTQAEERSGETSP